MSNESNKNQKELDAYILNVLRLGTLSWHGRNKVFENAREKRQEGFKKDGSPKYKYYWHCAKCHLWHRDQANFEADHIEEVGPLVNGDWTALIKRLYANPDTHWQCLCISCHSRKTATYNASRRYERKITESPL